ncbi:MAG: trypsin-like peptidase domain-containing protein [Flavobacteriales bacterium]
MNKAILTLILSLLISQISYGQEERIYYDNDWKGCTKYNANFYRICTFDDNENPVGEIRDYFITGELQSKMEKALYINRADDSKSIFVGLSIGYYKNGAKQFENIYNSKGEPTLMKSYFENGNIKNHISYKNRKYDGDYITYYESGKVYRKFNFNNGQMTSKFFIECDEFGKCQNIFYENFNSNENLNKWSLITKEKNYKSEIIANKGLLMETNSENGFRQTINIPLDLKNNFSIETIIDFKRGEINSGHGLIWGFKDWDNYNYFYISPNGYYKIGGKSEGINIETAKWTKSYKINQNKKRNQLKILRVSDKLYYSINGSLIKSDDFYSFRGNYIGFSINSGEKEVLFENLIVKQDVDNFNETANNLDNNSNWKGNGTGFFIDKNGYIATNYHVIKDANEIQIEFIRNGVKKSYPAKVIQSDKQNDISILKINSSDFKSFTKLPYNFKTNISDVGSNVFALGYPLALSLMGTEIKFTDGKISSKTGIQGDITSYQISVPIQPGNSGGPLFDFDGNLIGITSSGVNRKLDITENVNYAIKSSYLKNLVDVLDYKLLLPNDNSISNFTLTEKIKILSDYVVLIKIK